MILKQFQMERINKTRQLFYELKRQMPRMLSILSQAYVFKI